MKKTQKKQESASLKTTVKKELGVAKNKAKKAVGKVKDYAKKNPKKAALIGAAVVAGVAATIAAITRRKKK